MTSPFARLVIRQSTQALFRRIHITEASLIVVRAGRKRIGLADGTSIEAGPGEAVALSAGMVVDVTNVPGPDGDYRAEAFSFGRELIAALPRDAGCHTHNGLARLSTGFEACLTRCRQALDADGDLPLAIRVHHAKEALLWVAEQGIVLCAPPPALALTVRLMIAEKPARRWTTPLVLAALAASGQAMSEATLRRRLAAERTALSEILIDTRLGIALTLLQSSTVSMTRIALDCGYDSPSRFASRFRARFGIAPSAIRKRRHVLDRNGAEFDRGGAAALAAE